ncbi:venom acid phosphatase-like precursor [Nasonia vitripennis]|uniref:acid phosphatase n=1 Tax=Nasonia vitripennis TaxID=7425 RepID=A0A7M6UVX5_NASVI|nr:venom acid phosphatase-like precursor [Nasonia vitripennis]
MVLIMKSSLLAVILVIYFSSVQAELKLLNVVFRHGDRAPDDNGLEIYPNDPHKNDPFEPMRLGGLTNNGKMREYKLGAHLREHYGDFLGDIYHASEVSARSTNSDRTKMSLQLVLAALYPPKDAQDWNKDLHWQPIPATYVHSLDDNLMVPEECPKYLEARARAEASEEFQNKLRVFEPLMRNLTIETGKEIKNSNDLYFLWFALMSEYAMNLTLPSWAYTIFPTGKLLDGINLEYDIASFNDELKKLNGGMLLRKFIDDMVLYSKGDKSIVDQRIKLYSGHETNIAAVLQVLGLYYPHPPEYSSAVFVELHEDDGVYSVKVKYYKGKPSEHEEMTIKGCGSPCTLENFQKVLAHVTPSDEDIKCDKRSLASKITRNEINVASGIIKQIRDALDKENRTRGTLQ